MTFDAVLFDYSGVLTTGLHMPTEDVPYDPDALFVEMAAVLSSSDDNPWHALERGEIPLVKFVAWIEDRVPGGGVLFGAESDLNVMKNLELLPERLALASALRAHGVRVGLVTNNVAEWKPLWRPRLPEDIFEVVIDSADVGCRKPEQAIYERALADMGVEDVSRVLFIDDFEWNVAGAQAAGMAGLHCTAELDLAAAVWDRIELG